MIRSTADERVKLISANTSYDVPLAALQAYRNAASYVAQTDPGCRLSWGIVAAIGHVESSHGRFGGSAVLADGTTVPSIVGLPLNGVGPVAAIRDSDGGRLDGDKVWDRAVGPMQFIPTTWAGMGVDGDGDGVRDPNDFDDAALATALYLCSGYVDMAVLGQARSAILRYNQSDEYVDLVLTIANAYDSGIVDVVANDDRPPVQQPKADRDKDDRDRKDRQRKDRDRDGQRSDRDRPSGDRDRSRGDGGDGDSRDRDRPRDRDGGGGERDPRPPRDRDGDGGGTKPPPEPEPKPEPKPDPEPKPSTRTGTLRGSGVDWTVKGEPLVFPVAIDETKYYGNFDPDEPRRDTLPVELGGIKGSTVTVSLSAAGVVTHINGIVFEAGSAPDPPEDPEEPAPTTSPTMTTAPTPTATSGTQSPDETTEPTTATAPSTPTATTEPTGTLAPAPQ